MTGLDKTAVNSGGSYTRDRSEPDSLRREVDRKTREEVERLRDENSDYRMKLSALEMRFASLEMRFASFLQENEEALIAARRIAQAGVIGKSVVVIIISVTAAIGGVVSVMEMVKKWTH